MSAEALQVAKVYRHLLRAVKKHVAKEDRARHFKEYVTEEFRNNCKLSDPSSIQQKIKLAHNYTFLLNSVHHHQDLLFSYNIAVDRSDEMKKVLGKSAASVGLQLPENYQEYGVDYAEVFAPVARLDTIRLVVSLAAQNSWPVYQLDVKSAFLHGELNEKVFIDRPPGYVQKGNEKKVLRLKKALYGLKQAPRAWYSCIDAYFSKAGFQKCPHERTLFVKSGGGFKITRDAEGERFDSTYYKQMIGSLMYLSAAQPDMMYVVSLLSRFMEKPTELHYQAAKRVLRYLKGTVDYGLFYKKGESNELVGFSDSDNAGDLEDRKSTSGHVFMLSSGAVSWSSKKQQVVTLSTTEAEFIAAASCACQAVWLRRILEELHCIQKKPTLIYCDNSSTIKLSKNPVLHGRS